MPIRFNCRHCGQRLSVADNKAGTASRCPKCRQPIVVPTTSSPPASGPIVSAPAPPAPTSTIPLPPQANASSAVAQGGTRPTDALAAPAESPGSATSKTSPAASRGTAPSRPPPPAGPTTAGPPTPAPAPSPARVSVSPPVSGGGTRTAGRDRPTVAGGEVAGTATSGSDPAVRAAAHTTDPRPLGVERDLPAERDAGGDWDGDEPLPWEVESWEERESSGRSRRVAPATTVWPGWVVITQALLLGVMLLVGYGLGIASRPPASSTPSAARNQPTTVSGRVLYGTSGGTNYPDEGAVIMVFPAANRPSSDEKVKFDGLRPSDMPPTTGHPGLERLRAFGGGYSRADAAGEFRITVAKGGSYYVLVVSNHGTRREQTVPNRADLAQLGRYVSEASELIGNRRYRWRLEELEGDRRWEEILPY